jgi:signal transduction histidine kinase
MEKRCAIASVTVRSVAISPAFYRPDLPPGFRSSPRTTRSGIKNLLLRKHSLDRLRLSLRLMPAVPGICHAQQIGGPSAGDPIWLLLAGALGAVIAWALARRSRRITPPADTTPQGVTLRSISGETWWESDAQGRLTHIEDGLQASALRSRLGLAPWDAGGQPLDEPHWDAHRQRLLERQPFSNLTWVWSDETGRVRVQVDSGLPRFDPYGTFLGYTGVSRDVGSQVVADRARRLATSALLVSAQPVLWIEALAAGGWRVIWANAAACSLFDRSERELLERPQSTLFSAQAVSVPDAIEQGLRQQRALSLEVRIARRHGDERPVSLRFEPLPGTRSLQACGALLMEDRHEALERVREAEQALDALRQRTDERARQLDQTARELETFTYTISHDLRAPIRVIEGFARILEEDCGPSLEPTARVHLHRIQGSAARMGQMVEALLELSRLTGQPMGREPVDLSRLADLVVEDLRDTDPHPGCSVTVQPGMQVEGDRMLLRVMLHNLIGNAWKYSAKQTQARIRFERKGEGPGAVYCVSDNGAGFDMRHADRLFGVFQRLHSEAEFPGTGVGLATVRRIVRRHGGRIWAESSPGAGSRFYFTFWDTPTER